MDGVGVGEQYQAVARRQSLQHGFGNECFGEDATPDIAELVVTYVHIQDGGKLGDEIPGFHQAGFESLTRPVAPMRWGISAAV